MNTKFGHYNHLFYAAAHRMQQLVDRRGAARIDVRGGTAALGRSCAAQDRLPCSKHAWD